MPRQRLTLSASSDDLCKTKTVQFIKNLVKKQNALALAQLASRIASARVAPRHDIIKKAIDDMIAAIRQIKQSLIDKNKYASHEQRCTTANRDDEKAFVDKLISKIDTAFAESAKLRRKLQLSRWSLKIWQSRRPSQLGFVARRQQPSTSTV